MRRRRRLVQLAALGAGAALAFFGPWRPAAAAEFNPAVTCAVPEEVAYTELPLPHVAARLKAGEAVRIVTMGSGSTSGIGASSKANAYPERLAGELDRLFPGASFQVINLARRGQLAADMVKRFATEVAGAHPALVIWQTGTVDAVRGVDLGSFAQTLVNGVVALRQAGIDVILMNMQYSPHTSAALDTGPYRDYMRWVALGHSVILFHRYTMMKYWDEEGTIDFANAEPADQAKNDDLVHRCLAYRLAREIESAAKAPEGETAEP